ncbi:helix-turn-helix transcriptional regulator [Pandoraea anhela]|uniref:Transcriptional regulator n=1 Tax=Pandoraea anhela TaxID=2508295 RepID=A0A5E4YZJ1_9BURK|nr:AlpA family transcriptional regulator [Pandoraea anhela]VVE53333.1 transcriptional regulator [Pandoraea anhela]
MEKSNNVERLLKLKDVVDQVGFGKTAIYKRVKDGTFPRPVNIGYASRWLESEVQQWIAKQVAAARGGLVEDADSGTVQAAH